MVYSVVLVPTMFALRLVPCGVVKKGVISQKHGILPRFIPLIISTMLYTTFCALFYTQCVIVIYSRISTCQLYISSLRTESNMVKDNIEILDVSIG